MPKHSKATQVPTQAEKEAAYRDLYAKARDAFPHLPDGALQQLILYYVQEPKRFDAAARDLVKKGIEEGRREVKPADEVVGVRVISADDPEYISVLQSEQNAEPPKTIVEPELRAGPSSTAAERGLPAPDSEDQPGVQADAAQ